MLSSEAHTGEAAFSHGVFFFSLYVSGSLGWKAACYLEAMECSVQRPKTTWQGVVCAVLNRTLSHILWHPLVRRQQLQPVHVEKSHGNMAGG